MLEQAKPLPDPHLGERFLDAFGFALDKHKDQRRKGKPVPYIEHLMGVCSLVLEYGGDEDQAVAALLHDAVEDCGGQPVEDEIRARFGARVARIVHECTDSWAIDHGTKKPWLERKQDYLAHVPQISKDARLVSMADKLHNVRAILRDLREHGVETFGRFRGGREGTLWYYESLVKEFARQGTDPLLEELARAVDDVKRVLGQNS